MNFRRWGSGREKPAAKSKADALLSRPLRGLAAGSKSFDCTLAPSLNPSPISLSAFLDFGESASVGSDDVLASLLRLDGRWNPGDESAGTVRLWTTGRIPSAGSDFVP